MSVKPEEFFSETPPPRIIGTECEYNLQPIHLDLQRIVKSAKHSAGSINGSKRYLGEAYGSGLMYVDVGHIEFATAEALGPASAATQDMLGISHMAEIVDNSGVEHEGVFRMAGYYPMGLSEEASTRGYHENYMLPSSISKGLLFKLLIPSALAGRMWSGGGTLREEGYVLSQKIWGNGIGDVVEGARNATTHGHKPIAATRDDTDTIGLGRQWTRLELRCTDPGFSITSSFLGFAAISLALRLVEHENIMDKPLILDACLDEPLKAAKLYASDLSLRKTAQTVSGRWLSMLDVQENLLDLYNTMAERIELPEDEQLAISVLYSLIHALRISKPNELDYNPEASMRTNFAPKHHFVSAKQPIGSVYSGNVSAMYRNLLWDRVLPEGSGSRYWSRVAKLDPIAGHIQSLGLNAGLAKRAIRRAKIVDANDGRYDIYDWGSYRDNEQDIKESFGNPYGED